MRYTTTVLVVGLLLWAGAAVGLTATPTPTETPTITPTLNPQGALFRVQPCESPPCRSACIPFNKGHHTIGVKTHAGTAAVRPLCVMGKGELQLEASLAPTPGLTGASCTTVPGNCLLESDAVCDELCLQIDACTTCTVSGWVRSYAP